MGCPPLQALDSMLDSQCPTVSQVARLQLTDHVRTTIHAYYVLKDERERKTPHLRECTYGFLDGLLDSATNARLKVVWLRLRHLLARSSRACWASSSIVRSRGNLASKDRLAQVGVRLWCRQPRVYGPLHCFALPAPRVPLSHRGMRNEGRGLRLYAHVTLPTR